MKVCPSHSRMRPETKRVSMSNPAQVSPQSSPRQISLQKILRKFSTAARRMMVVLAIYCVIAQVVLADSVTYQQLQQRQETRPRVVAEAPAVVRSQNQDQQDKQSQSPPSQSGQSQSGGAAQESPNHPEFVRLPDGRIVRYGPGILCDENCVEPVTPEAFREPGPRMWWLIPAVSGAALCAFLCRGGDDSQPQPTPTIIIPPPTPAVTPTATPSLQPTPDVPEIPEPGTLVLFGLGIGAMVARRRMAARKEKD